MSRMILPASVASMTCCAKLLVVDVLLEHVPAPQLGHQPDRRRIVRERLIVDAIVGGLDVAEPVGIAPGDHLLDHDLGRIEVLRLRQHLRHAAAVLLVRDMQARGDDRPVEGHEGVGMLPDPALGGGHRAAGMPVPEIARDRVDEAGAFVDGALAARLAAEEAVDAADPQARDIFGRRDDAIGHVLLGIEAVHREIIAKLHRLVALLERNRECETLPVLGIAIGLVLVGQHQRIAVLVADGQDLDRLGGAAETGGHRQGDRHHLLGDIELAVDHLVADQVDAGDLLQADLEALAGVVPEVLAVDQRGRTGDRKEPDIELGLLERLLLLRDRLEGRERNEARERAEHGGGADRLEQGAAQHRLRKQAVQQSLLHGVADGRLAFDRRTGMPRPQPQRPLR